MGLVIDKLTGEIYLFDFSGSSGTVSGSTYPEVNTFADLPPAGSFPTKIYVVRTSTGAYVLNRREAGLYYSNGLTWRRLGDIPSFFNDDNFKVYDGTDNTKEIRFELSGLTSGLKTLTVQNANGTLAYLSNITLTGVTNVGSGQGVFKQISGKNAQLKSLVAGSNITISGGTNEIVISSTAAGGASVQMPFRYSNDLVPPPSSRFFELNSANAATATIIYFNAVNNNNVNVRTILSQIKTGNKIYLQNLSDPDEAVLYQVTADAVDNTTYVQIAVSGISSGVDTVFTNGNEFGVLVWQNDVDTSGFVTDAEFNAYTASTQTALNGKIGSANNGLTKNGTNVRLGGLLTGSTTIGLIANNLIFTGTTGTLRYGADYSANYTNRSLVDRGYVLSQITGGTNNAVVFSNEVGAVKTIKTNVDVLGQGQVILTNGSSVVSGISTNFTDATVGLGVGYWFQLWIVDSASNLYRISLASITNNTLATISNHFNISDLRKGYSSSRGATFVGVTGTYTYYIVRNIAEELYSFAGGNGSVARNFSFAFGGGATATGQTATAFGRFTEAGGSQAFVIGGNTKASGNQSFAGGAANFTGLDRRVLASGARSFNFSENNNSQTFGHGARAQNSVILGGINHDIPSNATRSAIIGGNLIKAVSAVTDTVYLPQVRIGQGTGGALTSGSTSVDLIVRNVGGVLQTRTVASVLAGLTANNGVRRTGDNFRLGGQLTGSTSIGLTANNLIFTATTGTLRYGADYSANYNVRSLVDKGYVTGQTSNLVTNTKFNAYTGATEVRISNIEDSITGLTGSVNELSGRTTTHSIQLVDLVGGIDVNTVTPTSIQWTDVEFSGTSLNYTGASRIYIQETGNYEISYNLTLKNGTIVSKTIGSVVRLNGSTNITPLSVATYIDNGTSITGSNNIANYKKSFTAGDFVELQAFRIGGAGSVTTVAGSSFIRIIKTL